MSGFITIERDLWDHELFAEGEMTEREAWVWMIAEAAWKDTDHRVGKSMHSVPRGSFMITLRGLQKAFRWKSDKRVRTFLKVLENEGMIGRTIVGQRNAPKTHVTIRNYDKYQKTGRTKDAPKTHHGRTKDAVKEQGNKRTSNSNELQPEGVSNVVWADFVDHRKRKKANITKTAMAGIERQASEAGWPIERALAECVERGWTSFKAEWVKDFENGQTKLQQRGGNSRKSTRELAEELCSGTSESGEPSDSSLKFLPNAGSHCHDDRSGGERMAFSRSEAIG